jgi:streptomycin 6-kinase
MVRLLEASPEQGAFLLERLEPGTMLATLTDDETATSIGAAIMRRLWRPAPANHPFPSVADWARGMERLRAHFGGGTGPFPTAIVEEAESLFADLLASTTDPVLLHGDLHHYNILRAEREPWLAIDPKGIVGDRGYEVGMFLLNPFDFREQPNPQQIMERRVYLLAEELGIERERVRGWGVAQAVLSAWWTVEENGNDWEPALFCAELLSAVKTGP